VLVTLVLQSVCLLPVTPWIWAVWCDSAGKIEYDARCLCPLVLEDFCIYGTWSIKYILYLPLPSSYSNPLWSLEPDAAGGTCRRGVAVLHLAGPIHSSSDAVPTVSHCGDVPLDLLFTPKPHGGSSCHAMLPHGCRPESPYERSSADVQQWSSDELFFFSYLLQLSILVRCFHHRTVSNKLLCSSFSKTSICAELY
jgi:hypothetical protein